MRHAIPDAALEAHIGIIGKAGSGKSNVAKVLAEDLLDRGERVCTIDPTGVWFGLRSNADGTGPGYKVVVFGGQHADIPISKEHGAALAEIVGTTNTPAVIDTRLMTVTDRTAFFTDFAETLLRVNRGPLHLIIDEAHLFAPQTGQKNPRAAMMLHAANNLISLGRAAGLRITLISQRPAKLHKDSLTQVETLITMRLIAPQDRKAFQDWVAECADPAEGREMVKSLPELPTGTGWVWSPEIGMLEKVTFPLTKTYDSGRAPKTGDIMTAPVLAEIDTGTIAERLASIGGKPKQKRAPKQVSGEIGQLTSAPDRAALDAAYERGRADGEREATHRLLDDVKAAEARSDALDARLREIRSVLERDLPAPPQVRPVRAPIRASIPPRPTVASGGGQRRMIEVLVSRYPARFTKAQWGTLAKLKHTGGTFTTYLSRLRNDGMLDESDGMFRASQMAMDEFGGSVLPESPEEIRAHWVNAVGPNAAGRLLQELIDRYPVPTPRDELADACGLTASGGTFMTYLSRLRSNGLINEAGQDVTASPDLFEGERP